MVVLMADSGWSGPNRCSPGNAPKRRPMSSDPRFGLKQVSDVGVLSLLTGFVAAVTCIDNNEIPIPDRRFSALVQADSRARGYRLPRPWRDVLRRAARLTELPERGALVAPGSLPDPYPYEMSASRGDLSAVRAVLDEFFGAREYLGFGTTRAVFSDGAVHVVKVPIGQQGITANRIEVAAFHGGVGFPVAPCELLGHPLLGDDVPLLRMARVNTDVDPNDQPSWADRVEDRQVGISPTTGEWVAFDIGGTSFVACPE